MISTPPPSPDYDNKLFAPGERARLLSELGWEVTFEPQAQTHALAVRGLFRKFMDGDFKSVDHYEAARSRLNELAGLPSNHGVVPFALNEKTNELEPD